MTITYTLADDPDVAIAFGEDVTDSTGSALRAAQETADANGAPCAVWSRDGWYTVCDVPPDMLEPNPEEQGWVLVALRSPQD